MDESASLQQRPSLSCKPELRVPLGSEAELPHARGAVQYLYTGNLRHCRNSIERLLRVRQQAGYLQIAGCAAACDAAMMALLRRPFGSVPSYCIPGLGSEGLEDSDAEEPVRCSRSMQARSSRPRAAAMEPIEELYACQAMFPDPDSDASFRKVMAAGAQALAAAFSDALAVLNRGELQQRWNALPAAAVEGLLASDAFGTDDEASVLLLLARWRAANAPVPPDVTARLCGLIRVTHLGRAYLSFVLPHLDWFPIEPEALRFAAHYAASSQQERASLLTAAEGALDTSGPAYGRPRAQCLPASTGLTFQWHVPMGTLEADAAAAEAAAAMTEAGGGSGGAAAAAAARDDAAIATLAVFEEAPGGGQIASPQRIHARGFAWRVVLEWRPGGRQAGAILRCDVPEELSLGCPGRRRPLYGTVVPDAQLTVWRRRLYSGGQLEPQTQRFGDSDAVVMGMGLGADVLELVQHGELGAGMEGLGRPRCAWAWYLGSDGEVRGNVTFKRRPTVGGGQ